MTMFLKRHDEVVRIDRRPGEITFWVRREDKSLASVTLMRPVWTHISEIGFNVQEVVLSEPDLTVIEEIRRRHPDAPLPERLRQLRVKDHEDTKISVIFANEAPAES
jgi:hypothetical protein